MPTKKKNSVQPTAAMKRSCGACRLWSIVGGVITIALGITLYTKIISLEYVVAILLILAGIGAIIGGGTMHHHHH